MRINGKDAIINNRILLSVILKEYGYNAEKTAVEINGSIIPRNKFNETYVTNDDIIEVVSFVGGG